MKEEVKKKYKVIGKTEESPNVFTLRLVLDEGLAPYVSGQYITVYFPESGTPEGKAYSISSAPHEGFYAITVKVMGEFSTKLSRLVAGDIVTASLPYGYFFSESADTPLVMIAAGIGISPFRSMLADITTRSLNREVHLMYTSRTAGDIVFKKEFDEMVANNSRIHVVYHVTREEGVEPPLVAGRLSGGSVLASIPHLPSAEFLICGSISFTRDMWRALRAEGIAEDRLYTEAFFSH